MGLLLLQGSAALNPRELFSSGEQGLWLDPSDFSTMWQDSAKTTPVTAAGDPVGYISDKSGRGNHAYQTTSASRPTLARIPSSGRRNVLTFTEQLDNAAWPKNGTTVTQNAATSPINDSSADKIVETATNAVHILFSNTTAITNGVTYTLSVYLKAAERTWAYVAMNVGAWAGKYVNLSNGAIGGNFIGAPSTASVTDAGNGWYRVQITLAATTTGSAEIRIGVTTGDLTSTHSGDGTSGILAWGAQFEASSTATSYQKVVATTDVTESGVSDLWHLVFDGSDDSLTTNSVDFTATAQMTTVIGIRSLANTDQVVYELSANYNNNTGTFILGRANPSLFSSGLNGNGAGVNFATVTGAASRTDVLSQLLDNTATTNAGENSLRLNAVDQSLTYVVATPNSNAGNFGNHILYIGRRGGSSLPLNGHIYQLIIRGKTTPEGKLLEAERFVARRTGVTGI